MPVKCNSRPYRSCGVSGVWSVNSVCRETFDICDENTQLDVLTDMGVSKRNIYFVC